MTKLARAALQVVEVVDVLLPRNRRSYNDMCAPSLLPAPLVAPRQKIMCRVSTHAFTLSARHIVFELFDTDLNHMIRSETCYDMTHRRWVMYQVRLPPLPPFSYPAVGLTLSTACRSCKGWRTCTPRMSSTATWCDPPALPHRAARHAAETEGGSRRNRATS